MKYENLPKYPKLKYFINILHKEREHFVNRDVYWTEKEDGSNVGLFLDVENEKMRVRSRNQNVAMFEPLVLAVDDVGLIHEYLLDNPFLIIYGEFLKKGRSPTGIHTHKKDDLVLFDIYDMRRSAFLPVEDSYDIFEGIGFKSCNIEKIARYSSYDELLEDVGEMQNIAKNKNLEGYVYKINNPDIFLKCKPEYDTQNLTKIPRDGSLPRHPQIPDTDVYAILHLLKEEMGEEDFRITNLAMPVFAERVSKACREDQFSTPDMKLFVYYKNYLSGLW